MNKRPPKNGEIVQRKQNTLLVDGNALFKAGFFGAKDSYNIHGNHIGGLYQFVTILRKLLTEDLYHKVYVFWDGNLSGKLRYNIYNAYKSDRGKDYINGTHPVDEAELTQRLVIMEYLDELYVRQLKHEFIESDDFIAYYCLTKKENEKITICTNDRDMAQLISKDVKIYFIDLKNYVGIDNFSSYFCYNLQNAALVKTMVGDTSDSIKGIKGLGEKTLLNLFPEMKTEKVSLTQILEKAKQLQEERILSKKKPLMVLDNIVNKVTEGIQGEMIYEINHALVNLQEPFMTEDGIRELEQLKNGTLDSAGREIKKVLEYMERDGLDKAIGEFRYSDYLIPFKQLINRENLIF
jgi:DNA polymerase-1